MKLFDLIPYFASWNNVYIDYCDPCDTSNSMEHYEGDVWSIPYKYVIAEVVKDSICVGDGMLSCQVVYNDFSKER